MPANPRISVITVSYNSVDTIAETLISVAKQEWPDVEHIVIDGGSTDGTLRVIDEVGQHVSRVISEPDDGIYSAMNKGVSVATGEIVGFLNADDHYANPRVLGLVARMMMEGDLSAVVADASFFRKEAPDKVVRRYHSDRFRPSRLAWGWMPAHPGLFVRREVFDRVGHFATDYRIAGDFEWIARAFHGGTLTYRHLPEVVVRMRIGGISTGGWRNTILLNREVLRACRANGISTNWFKILSKYPAKLLEFVIP